MKLFEIPSAKNTVEKWSACSHGICKHFKQELKFNCPIQFDSSWTSSLKEYPVVVVSTLYIKAIFNWKLSGSFKA